MANNIAFQAMGKTVRLVASSSSANNLSINSDNASNQYRIANHSAQPVYVWISPIASPVNVAAPVGSAYAIPVPPNTVSIITGPQVSPSGNVQVSVICESGTPDVYITPGEGL